MDYFLMPLTRDEGKDPAKKGYAYAVNNKSRWINLGESKDEVNTYDKGTTVFVYKGIVYNIFKDYVSIDEKFRVYIGCNLNASYDDTSTGIKDEDDYWSSTNINSKVQGTKYLSSGESIQDVLDASNNRSPIKIILASGTYSGDITIDDDKDVTIIGPMQTTSARLSPVRCNTVTSSDEAVINGTITISGAKKVEFVGLTFSSKANINVKSSMEQLSVTNNRFVGISQSGKSTIDVNALCKVNITENYFGASITSPNAITMVCDTNSTVVKNYFADKCCTDSIITVPEVDHTKSDTILLSINNNHVVNNVKGLIKLTDDVYENFDIEMVYNTFGTFTAGATIIVINNSGAISYLNTSIKLLAHSVSDDEYYTIVDEDKAHPIILANDKVLINSK